MITKIDGKYYLVCDNCEEAAEETFDTVKEAAEYRKPNGWKITKENGEWKDTCPECLKAR